MKIILKSIKVIESMSEETLCFTASVYVNGKLAGHAQNRGHGGCTDCHFNDPSIRQAVEAYVETLPLQKWEFQGQEFSRKLTVDDLIDELVNEHYNKKQEQKIAKLGQKHKKLFAEKGYPFTLEVKLPHQVSWTAVKYEGMVESTRKALAEKHKVSVDGIRLI